MKFLYLLLLLPGLALATGNKHDVDVVVKTGDVVTDVKTGNVVTDVKTGDVSTGSVTNDVSTSFRDSPSSAFAYAAQCGTGGGASGQDFSASVTGESQYCKHLRLSAFYGQLFAEAVKRGDNTMAQLWYNEMVVQIRTADSLIDATSYTGAAKETAGDLFLPALVCGGVAAIATPAMGYVCAVGIGIKAKHDVDEAQEREQRTRNSLEARDTELVKECTPDTCAYVNGELHHYE